MKKGRCGKMAEKEADEENIRKKGRWGKYTQKRQVGKMDKKRQVRKMNENKAGGENG